MKTGLRLAERPYTSIELGVLNRLHNATREQPLPALKLCSELGVGAREVKRAVAGLITDHGIKIGAVRTAPSGYFLVSNEADLDAAIAPYRHQIMSELVRLSRLTSRSYVAELVGQMRMEFEFEGAGCSR